MDPADMEDVEDVEEEETGEDNSKGMTFDSLIHPPPHPPISCEQDQLLVLLILKSESKMSWQLANRCNMNEKLPLNEKYCWTL